MLYRFDQVTSALEPVIPVLASQAEVTEKQIELAVAQRPDCLFRAGARSMPVLVVKKSVRGLKMADVIALDAEGRLVIVECKRGFADRQTLAQLLDYASDYGSDPAKLLDRDWASGEGRAEGTTLIEVFRRFADHATFPAEELGRQHVL